VLGRGLDYAVNRFYNPKLGRFLQPDPLGIAAIDANDSQSLNLYTYAQNDPINNLDPSGLCWVEMLDEWLSGGDYCSDTPIPLDVR
jgi:RHS repeat-associated protein